MDRLEARTRRLVMVAAMTVLATLVLLAVCITPTPTLTPRPTGQPLPTATPTLPPTATPMAKHLAVPKECPVDMEYLIAIEVEWLADTDGHAGEADEMKDGRKCWRVEHLDFHGQEVWPAWRCVVLEGPMIGTIQWEWRNPMRGD